MSFDDHVRSRIASLSERVSKEIVYRRVVSPYGQNASPSPPSHGGLIVDATAALGATQITISSSFAVGRLVAGDKLTIVGDSTVYSVTAPISAVDNKFTNVPITPALVQQAAQGASVSAAFAADLKVMVRVAAFPLQLVNGTTIRATDLQVVIPAILLAFEPSTTDMLIIDSKIHKIINVSPGYVASQVGLYRIQAR